MRLRILLLTLSFFLLGAAAAPVLAQQDILVPIPMKPKQKPKPKPKPKPRPVKPRTTPSNTYRQLPPAIQQLVANMVYVEGGTFIMGATAEDGSRDWYDEKPAHQVTLNGFYIGKYEVTQAEWQAVMGTNPSKYKGDNLPVESVNWYDCQEFIRKLNELTGKNFRLPTEAEWEYAARGGKRSYGDKYAGGSDIDNVAWYGGNTSSLHPVGQKRANELGLYDMSGNVSEWCFDWFGKYSSSAQTNPTGPSSGTYRIMRGGYYYGDANRCLSLYRSNIPPDHKTQFYGLRLAL